MSREDAGAFCANEQAFVFDAGGSGTQLLIAGDTGGCDHEWGLFAEFQLPGLSSGATVTAAEFRVRKTGYGDDATGLPYLGVFAYDPALRPVSLLRSDLSPTPPRLIVTADIPVRNDPRAWSAVKALYR